MYGGIRSGKWKREYRRDDTTTFTDVSAAEGLENLHKYTLAAMQSEISSLKKELKKHEKVCFYLHPFVHAMNNNRYIYT